jgi:hypothetical protein
MKIYADDDGFANTLGRLIDATGLGEIKERPHHIS